MGRPGAQLSAASPSRSITGIDAGFYFEGYRQFSGGFRISDSGLYAISYGSLAGPTVGSTAMTQGTGLFRSSIGSATPGNFAPSDDENPTFADPCAFGGMDVRVWTAVPSPSGFALFLMTGALASRRRRS